jgi:ATP-binding cassette subfamily B protein
VTGAPASSGPAIESTPPYRRLLEFVGRRKRPLLLGLGAIALTQATALATPLVLRFAIDDLMREPTSGALIGYGAMLLVMGVLSGVFRFWARWMILATSRYIEHDIRCELFAHMQQLPPTSFQRYRIGDLMSRATNDLGAVRIMLGPAVMFLANTVLVFTVALATMVAIDPWLTLSVLPPLAIVTLVVKVFERAIHQHGAQVQAELAEMSALVQEMLTGVRLLRAYQQEASVIERLQAANDEYVWRNRALIIRQTLFFASLPAFFGCAAVIVLWRGSEAVIAGRMTVGQLVAFNVYLAMLGWPMVAFGWAANLWQRGMASWQRLLDVWDLPRAAIAALPAPSRRMHGEIELRDLVFGYGATPVLDGVSARIRAGETAAFVGATGSGKSTLLRLLARLHEPPPRSIFIDGVDVRDLPLAALRRAIGFVPQEPFLFSDSLADNIAFGLDARHPVRVERQPRIERAGAIACLDTDVRRFPDGYDTIVGERGLTLSGGQRQRAALARAVILDPPLLLLDDALSAVDAKTEAAILSRLKSVLRQRTSIIVSHRISTVRTADVIFVLDGGRIVERGSDAELLAGRGLYYELSRKQRLEEELAAS